MQDELSHERLLASTRQREAREALQELRKLLSPGEYDADDDDGGGGGGAGSADDGAAPSPVSPLVRSGSSLAHRGGGGRVPVELKLDLNTPLRARTAGGGAAAKVPSPVGAAGAAGAGDADDDDAAATLDDLISRRVQAALTLPPKVGSVVVVDYLRVARVRSSVRDGAVDVEFQDDGTREEVSLERLAPYEEENGGDAASDPSPTAR
jgi:hypothetical protein